MIKYIIIIIIIIVIGSNYIQAQSFCTSNFNTPNDSIINIYNSVKGINTIPYIVRLKANIVSYNDGTGGYSVADIYNSISLLNNAFYNHNICFSLCGINYVYNDQFMNFNVQMNGIERDSLQNTNYDSTCVNIFFINKNINFQHDFGAGIAYGILNNNEPNNYFWGSVLVIGGIDTFTNTPITNTNVLCHEMGHILGLYHTHNIITCKEYVNGVINNRTSCGDYISDTPADPNLKISLSNVDRNNCTYIGSEVDTFGDSYAPDTRNIMSYSLPTCLQYFSAGQGARMRSNIAAYLQLQRCLIDDTVKTSTYLTSSITSSNTYMTRAKKMVETTNNFIVSNNNNYVINAGETILLRPGFSISSGATFAAKLEPVCNSISSINNARMQNPTNNEINLDSDIEIFPNPVTDLINVDSKNDSILSYQIIDIKGTTILFSNQVNQKKFNINLKEFTTGIYLIILKTENNIITKRFYKD